MNFLQKLFSPRETETPTADRSAGPERLAMIEENTALLWKFIAETIDYYRAASCPCAFPRFKQIASIDCREHGKLFYVSETEGFISLCAEHFTIQAMSGGTENINELWTCHSCGSTYYRGWSDFSIHVNRSFLKEIDLHTREIGAPATQPIPLFVGLFGHTYPEKSVIQPATFEEFSRYMREMKA